MADEIGGKRGQFSLRVCFSWQIDCTPVNGLKAGSTWATQARGNGLIDKIRREDKKLEGREVGKYERSWSYGYVQSKYSS